MLKLPRLPDRTPVRLTVTLDAPLNAALKEYATYLNGQHVSLRGLWRKSLTVQYRPRLPHHETPPAMAPRRVASIPAGAGGGA